MSEKISGILIDFDGVIKIGGKPAPDARVFLKFISESGIPSMILSNSSLNTGDDIIEFLKMNSSDFNIPAITAADAAKNYIEKKFERISVYCIDSIKKLFGSYIDDENPEAVVVGDLGDNWNYAVLNEIFRKVLNGAELIALHKNKFWKPDGKNNSLDAGPFVTAIEYACSKEAVVIGKPSPIYFRSALEKMRINTGEKFIMIGDDIENDINAVQLIGGIGILVYTGKTKFPFESEDKKPDYESADLMGVISILKNFPGGT